MKTLREYLSVTWYNLAYIGLGGLLVAVGYALGALAVTA